MVSKIGFRQHVMLLLFLDIVMLMFLGVSSDSFLGKFIANTSNLSLSASSGIGLAIITMFIGISAIGVTSGSNFAGISGVLSKFLGVAVSSGVAVAKFGIILAVITDYIMIYKIIIGGQAFGFLNVIAIIIFIPLIIDALFASLDWARGTIT